MKVTQLILSILLFCSSLFCLSPDMFVQNKAGDIIFISNDGGLVEHVLVNDIGTIIMRRTVNFEVEKFGTILGVWPYYDNKFIAHTSERNLIIFDLFSTRRSIAKSNGDVLFIMNLNASEFFEKEILVFYVDGSATKLKLRDYGVSSDALTGNSSRYRQATKTAHGFVAITEDDFLESVRELPDGVFKLIKREAIEKGSELISGGIDSIAVVTPSSQVIIKSLYRDIDQPRGQFVQGMQLIHHRLYHGAQGYYLLMPNDDFKVFTEKNESRIWKILEFNCPNGLFLDALASMVTTDSKRQKIVINGKKIIMSDNDRDTLIEIIKSSSSSEITLRNMKFLHSTNWRNTLTESTASKIAFYNCDVGDICADASSALRTPNLKELSLQKLNLHDKDAAMIAESLQHNKTLTALDLSFNQISDEGASKLAKMLETNTSLIRLHLNGNTMSDVGVKYFADALRTNSVLTELILKRQSDDITRELTKNKERAEVNKMIMRDKNFWFCGVLITHANQLLIPELRHLIIVVLVNIWRDDARSPLLSITQKEDFDSDDNLRDEG